jgi:hypothetical protein
MASESALSLVIGHLSLVIRHFRRRGTRSRDTTIVAGRVVYSGETVAKLREPRGDRSDDLRHRPNSFTASEARPLIRPSWTGRSGAGDPGPHRAMVREADFLHAAGRR